MKTKFGESAANAEKYAGTCPRARNKPSGVTSIPLMTKLLSGGLTAKRSDGIEIFGGVYFKRSKLKSLMYNCNSAYMFNPASLGVILGKTKVRVDDEVHVVVKSFDHGRYTLDGRESTITQWELLQNQCDQGVTLETDLQRYILHLVVNYLVMKAQVVPCLTTSEHVTTGMLWNSDDAIERADDNDGTDPESEMSTKKLTGTKDRANSLENLVLKIFTEASVENTLPEGFWPDDGDSPLRKLKFLKTMKSLSELNFLRGLGCVANHNLERDTS